jgi:hypothetical protein
VDEIRFELNGGEVDIFVNGRELSELAGEVELPFARAEGKPHLAGSYASLNVDLVGAGHFRGDPALTWFDDGDTVLLGCDCGEWGCWPLTVDVAVTEGRVAWSHFRQGHRDWDLSALGPFEFDRAQYDAALAELAES